MPTNKHCFWLAVVIGLSPCFLLAEGRNVSFPEVGVELPKPVGFIVSKEWQGLEHEATGSRVQITTVPTPFAEVAARLTADDLTKSRMTLREKSSITVGGTPALLLNVSQTQQGVEVGKWILVFGDKTTTILVALYPKEVEPRVSSALKSIVTSVRPIARKRRAQSQNVDFQLGPTQKLRIASEQGPALLYTKDGFIGNNAPGDPLVIVTHETSPIDQSLQQFSEQVLIRLDETTNTKIESQGKVVGRPYRGFEIIATSQDTPTGTPILIYQRLFVYPDWFFVFTGTIGLKQRAEFLPEFQRMADGFHRTTAGQPDGSTAGGPPQSPLPPVLSGPSMEPLRPTLPRFETARPSAISKPGDVRGMGATGPGAFGPGHFGPGDGPAQIRPQNLAQGDEREGPWVPRNFQDDRPRRDERPPKPLGFSQDSAPPRRGRTNSREATRNKALRTAKLPKPKQPFPAFLYSDDRFQLSSTMGSESGEPFEIRAPKGGVLVGVRVIRGDAFNGCVQAIEPIFQIENRYVGSRLIGAQGEDEHLLLAPAGYAVGGIEIASGLLMDSIRLFFFPIKDNHLDIATPKVSDWIGGNGGSTRIIIGDGSLIVGLTGTYKENLQSIGLLYARADDVKIAPPTKPPTTTPAPAPQMRVWKSSSGKFSITAKLESADGDTVKLVTEDGRKITIPLTKLSETDQQFLKHASEQNKDPAKDDQGSR